jgi:hypothetical protein
MDIVSKYGITTILIVIYLLLPVTNFAHAGAQEPGSPLVKANAMADSSPCGGCPCTDDQSTDCCDVTSCNCACHAPLTQRFHLSYSPVVLIQRTSEQGYVLPQVHLPIFVPPQNPA